MRLRRNRKSSPEAIENPKFYKLFKLSEEKIDEILGVFMKVKGECDLYESFMKVPIYKYYNIRAVFKDNDSPSLEDVAEVIHILTDLPYNKLVKKRVLEICKLYKFVINGLDDCSEKEQNLNRKVEAAEHKAGIKRLNPFGELTSLKMVADYYNESLEQAEQREYGQCFAVWWYQKEKADFDKAYFEIKNKSK